MYALFSQLSQLRSLPASTALASIYVKLFGQEIAFANIDKALIDQAIAVLLNVNLKTNFITKWLSQFLEDKSVMKKLILPYSSPLAPLFRELVRM